MIVRIHREDAAGLDDVRTLVCALKAHHAALAPELGAVRDDDEFWAIKRAQYERQLAEQAGALLVARGDDGTAIGFAFVVAATDSPTWPIEAVRLEDIAVAAGARGAGVGAQLMEAIRVHAGDREVRLHVLGANGGALRFYERQGFVPWILDMVLRPGRE